MKPSAIFFLIFLPLFAAQAARNDCDHFFAFLQSPITEAIGRYQLLLANGAAPKKLRQEQEMLKELWNARAAKGEGYKTVLMRERFVGEHLYGGVVSKVDDRKVRYFSPEERKALEVQVDSEGRLRNAEGVLGKCETRREIDGYGGCEAIFVMDADGRIFVYEGSFSEQFAIHHSSFLGGLPVASSGDIRVVNGKIEKIRPMSGHYLPNPEIFLQVVKELRRRGFELRESAIELL